MNKGLVLHSFRRCPFAIRVRMVLEEKQIDYQLIEEDLENFSEELLALHPEGRVPLLVHTVGEKKEVVFQSTIITEYLEDLFPQQVPLMPEDPMERARVRLWTYWCDHLFKPDLDLYKYELADLTQELAQELKMRLHQHLQKWDGALSQQAYLLGKQMTLADIHLFPFARQFMAIQPRLDGVERYSHLQMWLDQMISRPSFGRVMNSAQSF